MPFDPMGMVEALANLGTAALRVFVPDSEEARKRRLDKARKLVKSASEKLTQVLAENDAAKKKAAKSGG